MHKTTPGEIWVHLRTQCNYLSSLLAMYTCPQAGETPHIINGWRSMHKLSPYRVTYGTHNPAMRGLILTHDSVVPGFSWTPRLALEEEAMRSLMKYPVPEDVLVLPSITGTVVRVFFHHGQWYIASNRIIEEVCPGRTAAGPLGELFRTCLAQHCKRCPLRYLSDLRHDRVWFFGLYEQPPSLLHLGTCAFVPHEVLVFAQYGQLPSLDFCVHRYLAPCVPILPELSGDAMQSGVLHGAYDGDSLTYTALYDGIFLVNPATMFAVRLSTPDVVYLSPVLEGKVGIQEFLTVRVVEASMMETSRTHMDRMSRRWWGTLVAQYTEQFFQPTHADILSAIAWHVETISDWIAMWMAHMSSLCWEEWNQLDVDIQRLYVLLDYACEDPNPANWARILKHAKYSEWVAKVVVFTMNRNSQFEG